MKAKVLMKNLIRGEDITKYLDLSGMSRPNIAQRRINVDLPFGMIELWTEKQKGLASTRQARY